MYNGTFNTWANFKVDSIPRRYNVVLTFNGIDSDFDISSTFQNMPSISQIVDNDPSFNRNKNLLNQ